MRRLWGLTPKAFQNNMSRKKLKIYQTDPGNLISNLRGEIGEIITSWVLYKDLILIFHRIKLSDPLENIKDPSLNRLLIYKGHIPFS